jgi:hypothetical protein
MAGVEGLVRAYERFVRLPWEPWLAGPQKVWFALYNPQDDRRLRARVGEFEVATRKAGHGWHLCDLTDLFPRWMAAQEYRESYFESPEDIEMALEGFGRHAAETVREALTGPAADADTVVAISGVASLFGLTRVSLVIESVTSSIAGRLLVFFPGEYDNGNYRLLDARDGWNYLAVPITALEDGA